MTTPSVLGALLCAVSWRVTLTCAGLPLLLHPSRQSALFQPVAEKRDTSHQQVLENPGKSLFFTFHLAISGGRTSLAVTVLNGVFVLACLLQCILGFVV